MELSSYVPQIALVLQTIHHLFDIESAVFDTNAVLIAGSKKYLEIKGTTVHKPSIAEVIENDEVTVLCPGKMESCVGCRFSSNCPATLELLKRVTSEGVAVGVLSFSAFSADEHDEIITRIDYFKQIIADFSDLLATVLGNAKNGALTNGKNQFSAISALISDGLLITDVNGNILDINDSALNLLSGACLKSICDFLPADLSDEIMSGRHTANQAVEIRQGLTVALSSAPIFSSLGSIGGFAVRLVAKQAAALPASKAFEYEKMRGSGAHMESVRKRMRKIVNSPSSVFISGETGTGKGVLARSIHYEGNRCDKPFIIINCANIPESLFESELFGYEAGAFTGALKTGKSGKMELAEGGTLFLDEISEMPMSMQAKLLSVLQDRQFEHVGGTKTITLNTRIISASNANIRQRIEEGRFRADLFYRLDVISIEILPLRERMEDLPELLDAFLGKYNYRLHAAVKGFDEDVIQQFTRYSWPGNIRQLENIVEYCINMADGDVVRLSDLPPHFLNEVEAQPLPALKEAEGGVIRDLLNQYGWDSKGKARAAQALGISVRTLYRKIDQSRLDK